MGGGQLTGQVALILGGTGGIGRHLVEAYRSNGYRVAIHYHDSQLVPKDQANALRDEVLTVKADLRDEVQVRDMVGETARTFGRLDVLVNAVGLYDDAVVWKMEESQWDSVLDVNLKGAFLATKHAVPVMRQRNYGRVLHLSSVVGHTGVFGTSDYAAAKAGLSGFTRAVAREVIRFGITVNALVLGYVQAGMYLRLPAQLRADIERRLPIGRPADVKEVAAFALFLTSPEASYITGQEVHLNGGYFP